MATTDIVENATPRKQVFRREALTPAFLEEGIRKIGESGALMTNGHFIHHEQTPQEFHTTTWFYGDALLRDPETMSSIIPALVHKLDRTILDQVNLLIGIVTGGALITPLAAQFMQAERSMKLPSLRCMFLRHQLEDEYDLSQDDRRWLTDWREKNLGHSPNCLLIDDVLFSAQTTLDGVTALRGIGLPVVAMLHVAGATIQRPKLIQDIPAGCLYPFDPGKIYKPTACPMCAMRKKKTIV